MKRVVGVATVLALVVGTMTALNASRAADEKSTKIKDLMIKVHKGDASPLGKVAKELKADDPTWPEVEKNLKELADLGTVLTKEKGDITPKRYIESVVALEVAAKKKDKTAAVQAHQQLMRSCGSCHYGGAPK